jgi:AAA family ATP:ADP antiporter
LHKEDRQFSLLERFFSLATSLRPGEGKSILILTSQAFLTMLCYSLIRPVKEALILSEQGAEIRSYATGAQTLILLFLIPIYSSWVRKNSGSSMIIKLNLFFSLNLLMFYFSLVNGLQIGVAFYMWMAIFNVMVIAQFWAFTTDLYNVKSGQRLFVVIMLGASLGGLVGSRIAVELFSVIEVQGLVLLAAIILILTLFLSNMARHSIPDESKCHETVDDAEPNPSLLGGFAVVARDSYLIMIAAFMVFLNWVSTNGDYIIGDYVVAWANQQVSLGVYKSIVAATGAFYADYIFWVNLVSLALQGLLVSRLFRWLGVGGTVLILPLVMIIAYGLILVIPIFSLIRLAKITEMGINYSIANTTRQALFLPTSREAKYEGKMAIETFFWRFGDLFSMATVFIGLNFFSFTISEFVLTNLILSICMMLIAIKISHHHHQKVTTNVMNEAPQVMEAVENLMIKPGEPFAHIIPQETFYDPDPGDALRYKVRTVDGSPLPKWLRFISLECCFAGKAPENLDYDFELEIILTATDFDGLSATTCFKIYHKSNFSV